MAYNLLQMLLIVEGHFGVNTDSVIYLLFNYAKIFFEI